MLTIIIPGTEWWDEDTEEFVYGKEQTLKLEHSLVSLSKWESKWHKSFLHTESKTTEETIDYIRCMTLTQNVDPEVYDRLTDENIEQIEQYIEDPMTATTFSEEKGGKKNHEIVTSELIYYWMVSYNIPPEYQKWHLNRLITLIRVCGVKNSPPKKMSMRDRIKQNAEINKMNRQRFKSKG